MIFFSNTQPNLIDANVINLIEKDMTLLSTKIEPPKANIYYGFLKYYVIDNLWFIILLVLFIIFLIYKYYNKKKNKYSKRFI